MEERFFTKKNGKILLEAYKKISLYGDVSKDNPFTTKEQVTLYGIAKELIERGADDE